MKILLVLVFIAAGATFGCTTRGTADAASEDPQVEQRTSDNSNPVLVELFTSEGCSSCPPADRTLMFLEKNQPIRNARIIALGFHVDYWDYLGWKDKFSSPQFSSRQRDYVQAFRLDSSYTPQMVVDGETEFVGSNMERASSIIELAARRQKADVKLTINRGQIEVNVEKMPDTVSATIYLAVVENELSTKVSSGENSGSELAHTAVVRHLEAIGSLRNGKPVSGLAVDLPKSDKWVSENISFVVFVQQDVSKKIVGVATIDAQ